MNPEARADILLVEDSHNDIQLLLGALKGNEATQRMAVVRDGEEALDYYFRRGQYSDAVKPRVVLLDLKLPKLGGLQVLEEIKNSDDRASPIVIFTSSAEASDLEEAYRLGANSYVVKPIDFAELTRLARDVCEYWLNRNRIPPFEGPHE